MSQPVTRRDATLQLVSKASRTKTATPRAAHENRRRRPRTMRNSSGGRRIFSEGTRGLAPTSGSRRRGHHVLVLVALRDQARVLEDVERGLERGARDLHVG